jgi:hypothetical protein
MKASQPRNAPVTQHRLDTWLASFEGYRTAVTAQAIQNWLRQFPGRDRDLAARVLDVVEFIPISHIDALFRQILLGLPGWNANPHQRQGKWAFSAFSSSAGESGDSMLHRFRLANDLGGRQHSSMFLHRSELLKSGFEAEDSIVFVDDFAGTGNQVVEAWDQYFEEVVPDCKLYLVLAAPTSKAIARISEFTSLIVAPGTNFHDSDNVFHEQCTQFNEAEKIALLRFCRRADARRPKGYGDCGLVTVLAHNCPNNAIPILHANNAQWTGLFRRRQ